MGQLRIILFLIVLTACRQENGTSSDNLTTEGKEPLDNQATMVDESPVTTISLVKLIATPDKFDGRRIIVMGFMNVEFEENAIYLHKDDFENNLFSNGLWIDLTEQQKKEIDSLNLNKNYVLLEGTFNASGNGHFGLWSGEINEITSITKQQGGKPPIRNIKFVPPKVTDK